MAKSDIARQFWIRSPGRGELIEARLPPRGADEVRVRTLYSAISRGTESLVFKGEVPASQRDAMRAPFQEGDFPGPVKYGYISVGEVVEAPAETPTPLLGRTVFCLYPHQDLYQVPWSAVTPVPEHVPPERAVLAANMETAINVLWDARPAVGDRIVVVGAGVVGLLVAWLCSRIPGVDLSVVDIDPGKASAARALDLPFAIAPPSGAGADLVVHASGQASGLRSALALAGPEGTVVEVSWYGKEEVCLPLGEAFHDRRLTLRSSQVGRLPPERTPRWTHARRMALALELLADARLDALVTGESPFEELPELLRNLSSGAQGVLCHRVRYPRS